MVNANNLAWVEGVCWRVALTLWSWQRLWYIAQMCDSEKFEPEILGDTIHILSVLRWQFSHFVAFLEHFH
jgi:hypothetical protein